MCLYSKGRKGEQKSMKAFLKRKNIQFTVERYLITALNYMAMGLFSSLIIGLIIKVIGQQFGLEAFVQIGAEAGKKEIYGLLLSGSGRSRLPPLRINKNLQ